MLTLRVDYDEDAWVSQCPELGVVSQGDTFQEAVFNIVEATYLYLETLKDAGELKQTLAEKGIRP